MDNKFMCSGFAHSHFQTNVSAVLFGRFISNVFQRAPPLNHGFRHVRRVGGHVCRLCQPVDTLNRIAASSSSSSGSEDVCVGGGLGVLYT